MFTAAVGQSEDPSAPYAVAEVLAQIHAVLGDTVPQAGILFCSIDFDHAAILAGIRQAYPGIELAGCTTDGETGSVCGFSGDTLTLMVFATDCAEIRAGAGTDLNLHGKSTGRQAAQAARQVLSQHQGEEVFAVLLCDPLNAGVSEVNAGIESELGSAFPLIGAASAAHSKKRATYQFCNDAILTDSVVLLLFAGPVSYSFGVQGGHAPMGEKVRVTASEKNILYKIENEPALNYFRRYIGEEYSLFMNYCLAVFEEGSPTFYVRSAPFVDVEAGSVTLNGVIAPNAMVQIGTADKSTCLSSCAASLQHALDTYPGAQPAAALLFSCAGRKMMLGSQTAQETETVRKFLHDLPFCGFYAYGEFAPLTRGGPSLFHGTTFVTLLIGE
jgi:hypothetical protein